MTTPTRLLALFAALLCLLAGAVACGGGDDDGADGPDRTADLSAQQVLERSVTELARRTSFRLAFDVEGSVPLEGRVAGLLGDRIDISGEGPVLPPDSAAIDLKVSVSGLPVQGNITRVGDDVSIGLLGRTVGVLLPAETLAYLDFAAAYPELVAWIGTPTFASTERGGDGATVVVGGTLDPQRAAQRLAPLLGGGPAPALAETATGAIRITIGRADLLPRALTVTLRAPATAGAPATDLQIDAELSGFDQQEPIIPPQVNERLRPDQLGRLLGR